MMNVWLCGWRFFLIFALIVTAELTTNTATDPVEKLLTKFGTNYTMDAEQTTKLFESLGISSWDYDGSREESCSSSAYFHRTYSSNNGLVNRTDLRDLSPAILYELSKDACHREAKDGHHDDHDHHHHGHDGTEDAGKAWGFGILFVTVISLGSLLGGFLVPFMHKKIFQTILMAMVSLAVGVLCGSGIFHLIPHALDLSHDDMSYLWKLVMIAVGIYIFFLLECVMKMYLHFKTRNSDRNKTEIKVNPIANDGHGHSHFTDDVPEKNPEISNENKNTTDAPKKKQIATVAWMIVIGDGLHNFIDGLAIGVSCSTSVISGLTTSIAICCEELPHELGDFAILLNSGMTYKQAMLANFSSACLCYLGLVIGLILGFKTSAVQYIYGIAGGMFLYISLVDMLPESIQMIQSLAGKSKKKAFKLLLIQNFFILFGFGAMLLLSFYGHSIKEAEL